MALTFVRDSIRKLRRLITFCSMNYYLRDPVRFDQTPASTAVTKIGRFCIPTEELFFSMIIAYHLSTSSAPLVIYGVAAGGYRCSTAAFIERDYHCMRSSSHFTPALGNQIFVKADT